MSGGPFESEWDGQERRSIPFHLVNYMDEKLRHHATQIQKVFDDHTEEEMRRHRQVVDAIETNRKESEKRHQDLESDISAKHNELVFSLKALKEKMENFSTAVESAFPKNQNGSPDFAGHAFDHNTRMQEAQEAREFRRYIKRVVAGAIAISSLTWLWAVVWPALLAGPK